jgi:hypothetical protein
MPLHEQQNRSALAHIPWFFGREAELGRLFEALVDSGGGQIRVTSKGRVGKTALAQEFARNAADHFREVLWVGCGDRSAAAIRGDLTRQLGAEMERSIPALLHEHRLLVVLDDLRGPVPMELSPGARTSVLITSRESFEGSMELDALQPDSPETRVAEDDVPMWRALSCCWPLGANVEFAARVAGIAEPAAVSIVQRLISSRTVDPVDAARVRLNVSSTLEEFRQRHARAVMSGFYKSPASDDLIPEMLPALQWAQKNDWELACALGQRASDFLRNRYRNAEAAEILKSLRAAAENRKDLKTINNCDYELSWLQDGSDRVRYPVTVAEQLSFFSVTA